LHRHGEIIAEFVTRQLARGKHRYPTDSDIINQMHDKGFGAINTIRAALRKIRPGQGIGLKGIRVNSVQS
jgi:hypothetical protein